MKSKIIFGLFLMLLLQIKSFAQYEMYDLQLQMNMQKYQQEIQRAFNQVGASYQYHCFNEKDISCSIELYKMTGFNEGSAEIQNKERTQSQQLKVNLNNPNFISISVGEDDWKLNYGDRIIITYDGNSQKTYNVGIDDNMSEVDWKRYTEKLINESKQQVQSYPANNEVVYPVVQPDANSGNVTLKLKQVTCTVCKGTGISMSTTTVPTFGLGGQHWCDVCKMMVSDSHGAHKNCPLCQGRGYIEKYVP